MTHGPRQHERAAWVAVLVGVLALVTAGSAAAHTELIGSTPADGATMTTAPTEVVLEFNEPVQPRFGQVAVLDGANGHREHGDPQIVGATVTQEIGELPAGAYRISYRVASADGHPVTGTLTFTVAAAPTAAVEPTAQPTSSPEDTSDPHEGMDHDEHATPATAAEAGEPSGNTSALLVTGGGIVAAAVLGAVFYVVRAGRRPDEPYQDAEPE